jgi:hypothetical protein
MKKGVKIGIAIGAGVLGYLLVTNWDKIMAKLKGDANPKSPDGTNANSDSSSTEPGENGGPSEYEQKVEELQGILGVAIDGIPGKQTNGKLEELYSVSGESYNPEKAFASNYPNLNKWGKGVIIPANVKWYIEQVKNKWTPKDLTPYRRIGEVLNSYKKGWFQRRIELPYAVGTGLPGGYKLTGGYYNVPATTAFEVVGWNWQYATMYIKVNVNGVARVFQVYGPQLNYLSKDRVFKLY